MNILGIFGDKVRKLSIRIRNPGLEDTKIVIPKIRK